MQCLKLILTGIALMFVLSMGLYGIFESKDINQFPTPSIPTSKRINSENILNLKTLRDLNLLSTATEAVWTSDSNFLVLGYPNGEVQIIDLGGSEKTILEADHKNGITSLTLSQDNSLLATADVNGVINIWSLDNNEVIRQLENIDEKGFETVLATFFRPNNQSILFVTMGGILQEYSLIDGEFIKKLSFQHDQPRFAIASTVFSPDGTQIATMTHWLVVQVWDIENDIKLFDLGEYTADVWTLDFSSDGKILASGSDDNMIRLWDVTKGILIHTLEGHKDYVRTVRFNPTNDLLVSSGLDHTIRFWDVLSGEEIYRLEMDKKVFDIVFSPNGKILAIIHEEGISLLYVP
jgi:WD40 repeat protein